MNDIKMYECFTLSHDIRDVTLRLSYLCNNFNESCNETC